jgi:hypothetical protein
MGIFPPQEVTKHFSFSCSSVGCWKTATALKVAAELKSYGFRVRVRGHGKRPYRKGNNNPYDYVPLDQASHAMVYIVDAEILEERDAPLEEIDPRITGLIATLS